MIMDRNRIRRYWKAVLGIAASVMLCAGGILVNTYTVYAGSENEDPFAFRKGRVLSALQKKAKNYPDAFDLRNVDTDNDGAGDKSFVTSVKQQNPYGACWGFAAISAAESSLIADGLADENVDLSEKHVSYFAASYLDDPSKC